MLILPIYPNPLVDYLPLIVGVFPLLAAVVAGLVRERHPCYWLTSCLLALSMLLGGYILLLTYHGTTWHNLFTWLRIPSSPSSGCMMLSFRVDFPVAVMVSLTTTLHFITHLYALAYMQATCKRYIMLTGGFVSAMIGFLMADNLLTRFIGWDLIGLGSYLLISFQYAQESAARNGTHTWLINQMGSMSLLIGILIINSELDSTDISTLATLTNDTCDSNGWLVAAKYCLWGGVCTKSVQFPWFSWLSRAMTAPIPASALIHTATMVGAGVYLWIDLAPALLGTVTCKWIAYWGSLTAFMGAYMALTQQHIKQVLAYSTISQLGYVMIAIGVGASHIGIFHFITHAFGKACLFLCVGTVSRFMLQQGDSNTMQHMGGLYKLLPGTFWAYLLAACSLVGIPGLAGSLSKDAVLSCTLAWAHQQALVGNYLGYIVSTLLCVSSSLSVVYMGRQCYLVFMGSPRWLRKLENNVPYRTPWLMQTSLFILALCVLGYWYRPLGVIESSELLRRLVHTPILAPTPPLSHAPRHVVTLAAVSSIGLGILILLTWKLKSPNTLRLPNSRLAAQGWYLDVLTNATARGSLYLSRLAAQFDHQVVNCLVRGISKGWVVLSNILCWLDQKLLNGVVLLISSIPRYLGRAHQATQQGNLQQSLLWIFIGMGLFLGIIYWATQGI